MTTPTFILDLRRRIGHDLLWLSGVTAFVEDVQGRILLGRRADTGQWALIYGIIEPGEQPADTVIREVKEETDVDVDVTDLVSVTASTAFVTYANGDRTQYLDHSFLCEVSTDGQSLPAPVDGENLEVGWFPPDGLPQPVAESTVERLSLFRQYLHDKARGQSHGLFYSKNRLR